MIIDRLFLNQDKYFFGYIIRIDTVGVERTQANGPYKVKEIYILKKNGANFV